MHDIANIAPLENNSTPLAPGTAEIGRVSTACASDSGLVEDIDAGVVCRVAAVRCDEARSNRFNVDFVEPGGCS